MIRTALILAAVALITSGAQTTSEDVRNTIELMCGKVTVDHKSSGLEVKSDGIYGAIVQVYMRPGGSSCCANLPLVAENRTGFFGSFRFKKENKIPEGNYWLAVELKKTKKECALPVRLMRVKGTTDSVCDDQVFEIKTSGEIILDQIIVVD